MPRRIRGRRAPPAPPPAGFPDGPRQGAPARGCAPAVRARKRRGRDRHRRRRHRDGDPRARRLRGCARPCAGLPPPPAGDRRARRREPGPAQLDRFLSAVRSRWRGRCFRATSARAVEQHRALAAVGILVDQPAAAVALQRLERARPVAVGAVEIERRLSGPGERRRRLGGLLGITAGGGHIVAPLRLDEQAVQAQQLGLRAVRHGAERRIGAAARAGELRGLRLQQQRQRLVGGMPRRLVGVARARRADRRRRWRRGPW